MGEKLSPPGATENILTSSRITRRRFLYLSGGAMMVFPLASCAVGGQLDQPSESSDEIKATITALKGKIQEEKIQLKKKVKDAATVNARLTEMRIEKETIQQVQRETIEAVLSEKETLQAQRETINAELTKLPTPQSTPER